MDTSAKSVSQASPRGGELPGKPRVMVIDDEESILDMLTQALTLGGFEVDSAAHGRKGLELLSENSDIQVVLTDLMMPVMGGLEVLEEVKQANPDIEVIVLTGLGSQETAIEALKKGAYDYLHKPVNMEELFLTVRKALERHQLTVENKQYQKNLERIVKQRTAELTETKNFLQSVLDSSRDYSIIAANLKGEISLFNDGAAHLLHHQREKIRGRHTRTIFPPGEDGGAGPFGLEVGELEPGKVWHREGIAKRKDGTLVAVSMSLAALADKNGRVIGALCIAKDITEQKKLEREVKKYTENLERLVDERTRALSERNKQLEDTLNDLSNTQAQLVQSEKMASIGQLAAGVAHEINNPIGFVNSNLSTLRKYTGKLETVLRSMKEKLADDEDAQQAWKKGKVDFILDDLGELIEESIDGTQRVRTIVKDLKTVSNIDRSQIVEANLEQALDSTLNIVWNEIKYKAKVEKDYGDIPQVVCNPQQLNQVFLNLLVNAAHAIDDPPGLITVRTRSLDDDEVAVEIEDNGCGMDEQTAARIFDAFYTTKEVGKGTGLGLSISQRIVREHGGRIDVESTVGEGTVFRIVLPVKYAAFEANAE